MGKREYLTRMLELFRKENVDITLRELDLLLLLRQKTDQLMLEKFY